MRGVLEFWENRPEVPLPEVAEAVAAERRGGDLCNCELPVGPVGYWCTRRSVDPLIRHRHIACAGSIVVAAWPGDHTPCLTDMEA